MKEEQKIQTKNTAGFMDSNVKHLYDAMISQGYTGLGDFSNFEGKMKDSGKRRMVYDYLIQDDYFSEIGDFSKFESALGYSPAERKDYVSQSSVNPAPIALRQEVDVPMKDQSEYVNPWTNSPDYNFESLRKKGKIETATPPPPTEYEKDSSLMNTWAGDAIQKLNAGGADLGAGIFGVLDKAAKGLESATGGLIPRGGAFKDISDRFKADAEFSRARSNRYNGKDFTDLWKEGNYMGAIGDIALQGVESLPMSIGAMAATMAGAPAAGLAGIGSIVASQKYDDLDQNNPNMGEFAKVSNAILTGTAESLSEMLGAGVSKAWMSTLFKTLGKEKAQEAIKRGIMGKMQEFYKKFGMFFEPVNEGIEEVSSTLAENITDKITGADPERDLTDGVLQSFVYGMGGGAYFTGAGALAKGAQYVADKIGGKQAQQPITDSNVTDQGVETPPLLTKSRFAEAEEEGRNMTDPGDIRTASKKMEETRLSLSGMVPGLASTIESYVDDGASEAQVMSLLDGVNADARPLAEDFYADYLRISGLQDRIGEEIDNEVETYVANNITPYVTTNPDGQSIVTTATLSEGNEERPVYVRSIEGDKAVISDNGQDRMVSVKRLSDIVEQDAGHMRRTYEDQLLATRQSELDMTMHHNPKTQLPKPGLIVWNGDNAFILQGQDENGDWIAQPAAYDRETGQVTAKNGSSPAMPITENEILDLQDAIYDAQQVNVVSLEDDNVASADAEITSAPPVEDAINQPTSEIETEGAIDQIAQPSNVENPSMVMREDGTPDFVSSGTDMALDFLYDKYGDKMPRKIEVTRKSFDESLKKASDALEKAQEAYDDAPIGKEDKAEAALIKARQEYEAIKVEADFWDNLDDDIKEASKKPGDVIAKEISVMGDPMSGEELAAMMLANGAIKLTRDTYKKETGAGNNETARMFGLFASPEKGGVNIERAGEILELADKENGTNFFDENDTNAGRDAIIEVLSSARTRGDLIDYVKRNREAIAERERQAEYNDYAEWCEENYHMSPEKYEAYEDDLRKQAEIFTEETIEYVNGEIADEIQAIINEQNEIDAILAQNNESNEEIERNDEGGTGGLLEGGDQLLQGEQPIQVGRTGETEQGFAGVDDRVDSTDGATQEGAPEEVDRQGNPIDSEGNLIIEDVSSVSDITDEDFINPKRSIGLPPIPQNVSEAIASDGKKVIIKRNIFEKNAKKHAFDPQSSRDILEAALYNTDIVGQSQPLTRKNHWVAIKLDDKSPIVVLEVNHNKDNVEIVGWYTLDNRNLDRIKRQAEREGGELLILTPKGAAASLSTLPDNSSSTDKGSISSSENQANEAKSFVAPSPNENENPLDYAERIVEAKRLFDEELKVNTNPSEAQKEAGNYKKGHIKINGFDVTIEQPAGSVRSGKDASGKEWSQVMNNTYGYIRGTESVDGDHIDVFLGPDMNSDMVYVVDQVNTDGSFDEHKVMMGFSSLEDARSAYLSNYEEGWQGLGNITGVALDEFKKWIDSSIRKTKPFSEYKSVVPVSPLTVSRSDKSNEYPLLDIAVDPIVWMKNNPGKTPTSKDLFPAGKADEYLGTIIDEQVVTTDKGITLKYTKYNNGYSITAEKEGGYIKQSYYNNGLPMTSPKFNIGVNDSSFKQYIKKSKDGTLYIDNKDIIPLFVEDVSRKVKKLSLVDKDDYITSAERKHIKAFLESGLKEARVNNSIYEISNIGDDGVYEIVRRFNYTDPLTLVKDENGKLVNKRGEGEHVIRVKPTFEETRPDSGIRFRETRIIPEEENIIKKAKSDGSYMKAPNGNPTNLNEKQWVQVRTKAFKEWFGDWENDPENASKVIDENGEPRVVYHGTDSDFNAFDESHLGEVTDLNATNEDWAKTSHIGFWFNDNKIGFYTKHKPVYLNVRNPLEFASMESLVDEMSYYDSGEDFKRSNSDGYDSVIVLEDEEMGGRSYSVFNDNQIKSATENNGGFSSHNDDIRFREVKDKNGEKSLVGLHNISEEKLRKALRQGGFANPSAAVIDISRQSHTGYGSISLVLPSSMIEKRTGKNAGTWSQDAWTPIYPTIERQFSGKGSDAFSKDLQKLPEEMRSTTKSGMDSYMDGRGEDSLAYMYLYEQGKAPEISRTKPSYPEKTRTEVEDATNGSFSMSGLSDKQLSRLKDTYMEYKGFSTEGYNEAIKLRRAKLEEAIGKMNPRSILYEKRKMDLERIDKYGFDYSAVESFMKSVRDDISNSDKVDAHGTMRDSWNFIEENGMRGDFNKWLDKLNERYGIKEIIFNGFTPSGIRKYIPNTLENVSKFMKKQGRSASVGIGASFQNFAASLLDAKGSLKDIRKDKGKLTTDHADVDAFRDKWSKVFHELGEKLQPDAKGYDDYGLYRLAEAARSKDPQKYIKEEYGIDFSDEDVKTLNEMVDAIRNEYPAMYFETKFERPVYLEEFAAAVVPDNVDGDIRKAIYDAGLKIFTYKADDEISRNEAVKQASEIDGVRFRSIGEKGAANLNKAETIESSINDWSTKFNTPVKVIHDVDDITDTDENMLARKRDSKGWYDTSTGEIVIVSPNSTSVGDAQRTFLHEVVGHHGLRELFGDDFDTFLDNVYRNANEDIWKNIIDRTKGNPLNLREATEEYLAELAERGFDNKAERSLWEKIKDAFLDMLRKAGISLDFKLSDNDLRYILWRSYKNLEQGNLMDVAEDIVMRNRLGLNNINLNENGSIARDIEPEKGKQPSETKGTGRELETIDGVDENGNESERDHIDKPRGVENAIDGTENTTDRNGREIDGKVDNDGDQLDGGDTGDRSGSVRDGIDGERTVIGRAGSENKGRGVGESVREKTDDFAFAEKTIRFRENARNESVLFADNDIQVVEKQVGSAKDQYERTLSTSSYQFQEAFQDSMLGLKTLQDAVAKATRSRILDYENAYMAENALSSVNEAEFNAYRKAAFEPILKAMSRLEKMGSTIDEIRDYLITKHGIERNREMAVKRALSQNSETYKSLLDEYIGRRNEIRENGRSWEEQQSEMDRLAEEYGANLSDDFSGFTSMYPNEDNTGYDPDSARRYVLDYESRYDTSELSASVKRATDAILAKQRDSGLMSQNTFESISDMYQFYVPLRGWEETTADEVYAYLTSESQTFNAPIKTVVGRKSKADDPIATIANMAESGIMQGNRNLMKQKFLTMVQNHKTDLVSVSEMWVRLDEASGEWIAVFPDIPSNANPEQVESIVESFNKRMEELSNEKGSNVRRSRDAIGIPYKILPKDLKEHQVIIKRAGKEYVLTINGNPRAAQALNGLTNPDNTKGWFGTVERYAGWLNRNLAANFTTRNPNFMVSNFLRDALYSNTTVWVKESPVYAWKFNKNFAKVNPINMYRLVKGYENGTLDMSDPLNKAYHDFVMRGGETGYTNLRDVEAKKKAIQKELQYSKQKVSIGKALKILGEWMDLFNKSVENCARFAAFLTSREIGRSMDKSIYDAKEISVNFNKKGAGSKFLNTEGQTKIGNASAFTSGLSRSMYVFWNAGVQGMYNFGRLAKDNPKKFLGLASSFYLLGTIMPMIAAVFGDDEDDDYYDLPEYVRRNNICFRNGGGNWITIPMPIELRAIYGLGEMSSGIVSGKEKYTDKKMAMKIAEQMSQVLPLDMMEGGGGFSAFVPSSVKPLIEAGDNKDWTGLPLYKDNDFNKGMPEWTKAFKSVDPAILAMTKYANELTGGDKYTTGTVNLNPAIIEHILDGYFGGIEATRSQMVKSAETAWGSRDFDWRNIPVGNRLIKSGDERTKKKAIDNAYYENLEEMDKIGQKLRGYRKELSNPQNDSFDIAEYQKKLNNLMMSDEYRGYVEFNNLNKLYQSMGEYLKKVDDEKLEMELYDLKAMMNEIANGK